jgi:hypothetical protein
MSLEASTEVLAFATVALASFAVVTAIFAWLAFRKQSAEVTLLQDQAKRDIYERRRAQASHIFLTRKIESFLAAGPEGSDGAAIINKSVKVICKNTSDQPVFDVTFTWYWTDFRPEGRKGKSAPVLMPGLDVRDDEPSFVVPPTATPTADVTFRDAAGVIWRRDLTGELVDLTLPVAQGEDVERRREARRVP